MVVATKRKTTTKSSTSTGLRYQISIQTGAAGRAQKVVYTQPTMKPLSPEIFTRWRKIVNALKPGETADFTVGAAMPPVEH